MNFHDAMIENIMSDFNFNREVAEIVYSRAYETGHSAGYYEIERYCLDFGNFAEEILNASA